MGKLRSKRRYKPRRQHRHKTHRRHQKTRRHRRKTISIQNKRKQKRKKVGSDKEKGTGAYITHTRTDTRTLRPDSSRTKNVTLLDVCS